MRPFFDRVSLAVAALALGAATAEASPSAGPAYVVGSIPLPAVNASDVAVSGTSLIVGIGPFGAGAQSVIRLERDGTATTLATGLNALGGVFYDEAGDRALFTDNAGELPGTTTGDTVYALANPRTAMAPVAASTLELVPAGTIPFAQAVLGLAGGDVLVGDAAGPGSGRVVKISGGIPSDLIPSLDYTAGVALTLAGDTLLVGNVDGSFVGAIERYSLAGASLGTLASGLSGAYDQAVDAAGNLLVTGGFGAMGSNIVRITPGGGVTELANGFGFSTGITIDGPSGQVMVLDFGLAQIDTLTPVDGLTPGGSGAKECHVEAWGGAPQRSGSGKPRNRWTCTDGDVTCDRDLTTDGACTFLVGTCVTVSDARAPKCVPQPVETAVVSSKKLPTAAAAIQAALAEILPSSAPACSRAVPVSVPADKRSYPFGIDGAAGDKRRDKDTLKLQCLPTA